MQNSSQLTPEESSEKVYFCRNCHSLHILVDDTLATADWDGSYCGKCYCTSVGVCTMGEWLEEEERRERQRIKREWNK